MEHFEFIDRDYGLDKKIIIEITEDTIDIAVIEYISDSASYVSAVISRTDLEKEGLIIKSKSEKMMSDYLNKYSNHAQAFLDIKKAVRKHDENNGGN